MWVEVTQDFGSKGKDFFYELEAECGLDPDVPGYIWLIHNLFFVEVRLQVGEKNLIFSKSTAQ